MTTKPAWKMWVQWYELTGKALSFDPRMENSAKALEKLGAD